MFDSEDIDWSIIILIIVAVVVAALVLMAMKKKTPKRAAAEAIGAEEEPFGVVGLDDDYEPEMLPMEGADSDAGPVTIDEAALNATE